MIHNSHRWQLVKTKISLIYACPCPLSVSCLCLALFAFISISIYQSVSHYQIMSVCLCGLCVSDLACVTLMCEWCEECILRFACCDVLIIIMLIIVTHFLPSRARSREKLGVFASVWDFVCLCLLFLSVCDDFCLCLSLCGCVAFCFWVCGSEALPVCPPVSVMAVCLSVCFCLCRFRCVFLFVCLSMSFSLAECLSICVDVSVCVCVRLLRHSSNDSHISTLSCEWESCLLLFTGVRKYGHWIRHLFFSCHVCIKTSLLPTNISSY